jgi:hypothetical protein
MEPAFALDPSLGRPCAPCKHSNVVALRGLATRLNLATTKQTLKDLHANVSVAVSKFGEC